ncbi:TetR/AcrR family transcriptional regulator [Dongia sedimenti]|uniref:TetR/AcrR family transcriptional regulator n=1 Tax=Dongia sedimenti TaxID=3064282 RepID=A0ABU0YTU2_9PROT|nr:TetR/AcrR family transcriptional regulator [Rhodospirillaceae bacterium R-7]
MHGRILDAAAELFTKNGYAGTSIEAIAARAGIGKLTLYRRFADKDAVFLAVALRMAERSRAELREIADGDGELADVLGAIGRHLLGIILSPQSIAFHRILFAEAARLPELFARIVPDQPTEMPDATRRLFHRLAERGLVRREDVAFLDQQFVHAIIGKPLRKALFGASPMTAREQEEHVRKAVALFMHGMTRYSAL